MEPPYRVHLFDERGQPMPDLACTVAVDDRRHSVTSDSQGWIEFPVGEQCPEIVTIEWKQGKVARTMKVRLQCHEGRSDELARSRLWNLGFQCEYGDDAILAFKNKMDMEVVDGELPDDITNRISAHWTERNG